jgi:hypothetical protein
MPYPSTSTISAGVPHRVRSPVEMLIYDYDSLPVEMRNLPAGAVFQPWEPELHLRGERVPITLGNHHSEFDWGVTSGQGHFLRWDDFFLLCEPLNDFEREAALYTAGMPAPKSDSASPDPVLEADPFAQIEAMRGRQCGAWRHFSDQPRLLALFGAADTLREVHRFAAEMQLGAEGFDNTESARHYRYLGGRMMIAARAIADACRELLA